MRGHVSFPHGVQLHLSDWQQIQELCFLRTNSNIMANRLVSSSAKVTKARRKTWLSSCCNRLFHSGSQHRGVEDTYGVAPVRGPENDPATEGSTPDDRRADEQHHQGEPKEVTKDKAAVAQQEPVGFQVKKTMPGWDKPPEESPQTRPESSSNFTILPADQEHLWRGFGIAPTFA